MGVPIDGVTAITNVMAIILVATNSNPWSKRANANSKIYVKHSQHCSDDVVPLIVTDCDRVNLDGER